MEDAYPLAALQTGMLFHSAYSPELAVYHNVNSYYLRGPLDVAKMEAAIHGLLARHAVLRTSFDLSDFSEPLQLVYRTVNVPLPIVDIRHLAPDQQEAAIAAWIEAEKQNHFDWTRPPLLRFCIQRRGEDAFQFCWVEHHAILDGWSVASLITELFQRYVALLNEEQPQIGPPPQSTYRDFVALERQMIASEQARAFWRQKLSYHSVTTVPRWPLPADTAEVRHIRVYKVSLDPGLDERLRRLAQTAGVPLKSILLAAHLRVLSMISGQSDVTTGLLLHGRAETADGERVLGLFLNTLPLRLELGGGTWLDLVYQTFAAERELLPYRRFPLATAQQLMGGQALFETLFTFINFHVFDTLKGSRGLQYLDEKSYIETNFDFAVYFVLQPSSQLDVHIDYSPSAFCEQQIVAIAGYYARALATMAADPSARYHTQPLLSAAERHQLLVAANNTPIASPRPHGQTIHALFEAQATATPDAVAVVFDRPTTNDQRPTTNDEGQPAHPLTRSPAHPFGPQCLTYRELDDRANQLAHHLRALGVGPEVCVGICLPRAPELLVALLAILKAGAAYVPLDPAYPISGSPQCSKDSQARRAHNDRRPTTDDQRPTTDDRPTTNDQRRIYSPVHPFTRSPVHRVTRTTASRRSECRLAHDRPAATTSRAAGAAGQPGLPDLHLRLHRPPKGVAITHAARSACCTGRAQPSPTPSWRGVLASTSIGFDLSVFELFGPLCWRRHGRSSADNALALAAPPGRAGGHPDQHRALGYARAAALRRLPALGAHGHPGRRAAAAALVQRLYAHPHGPAASTTSTAPPRTPPTRPATLVPPDSRGAADRSAARSPTPRSMCWTPQLQPVPIGVPGELYIGGRRPGARLSRPPRPDRRAVRAQPLRRPTTNDRTTNDQWRRCEPRSSFVVRRSSRLYKTGDLARYLPDGDIEYPGAHRSAGEGARLPHRAGGGRGGAGAAPGGARGGGAGPRG